MYTYIRIDIFICINIYNTRILDTYIHIYARIHVYWSNVHVHIYMYMHTYTIIGSTYIYTYVCTHIHVYWFNGTRSLKNKHAVLFTGIHRNIHIHLYMYIYIYTYIDIDTFIYINICKMHILVRDAE